MKETLIVAFQTATTMVKKGWGKRKNLANLCEAPGTVHTGLQSPPASRETLNEDPLKTS